MTTEILIVKDPHICIGVQTPIGRNPSSFYDDQRSKLGFIRDYCLDNNIKTVISTGDNLNYKNPSLYTANSINVLIKEFKKFSLDLNVYSVAGNHDLKMSSRDFKGDSVYNILSETGVWKELHNNKYYIDDLRLTGLDYNSSIESLKKEIKEIDASLDSSYKNILVVHEHLLPDGEILPFSDFINYGQFKSLVNIDVIVAGHLHKGYPTMSIKSDSGKDIYFVNCWNMTRLSRDNYAMSNTHIPEVAHLIVKGDNFIFKTVSIPHNSFEDTFILDSLKDESKQEIDINKFVSILDNFNSDSDVNIEVKDLDQKVKEKIEYYLEVSE